MLTNLPPPNARKVEARLGRRARVDEPVVEEHVLLAGEEGVDHRELVADCRGGGVRWATQEFEPPVELLLGLLDKLAAVLVLRVDLEGAHAQRGVVF